MIQLNRNGLVTYFCRSKCSFRPLGARKPRGFYLPCGMSAAWVIEAVDVLEDGGFGLATRFPRPAPNQLDHDRLEEGLNGSVVIAVAFSAHRRLEPMLTQDLLVTNEGQVKAC